MMPTRPVERQVLLPHRRRQRGALFLSILLTSLMTIIVTACGTTAAVTSPLSAVPPGPGMILLRDHPSSTGAIADNNALGAVVAVDLQNGKVLWRHNPDVPSPQAEEQSPVLQPLLAGGLVYVQDNYADEHGNHVASQLVALDAATGQERWKYNVVPSSPKYTIELDTEPVEADGVLYFTVSEFTIPVSSQQPQYFLLQAVDSDTGTLLWSRMLTGSLSTPTIVDGNVLILANNGLLALRTADGSTAWTFDPAGASTNTPVSAGFQLSPANVAIQGQPGPAVFNHLALVNIDVANFGASTGIDWFAVNTRTGKVVWENTHGIAGGVYSIPALNQSGDVLCTSAFASQSPSVVQGLSLSTGKTLWSHSTSSDLSLCAAFGNTFYLSEGNQTGTSGGVVAFDSHTGKQLWETAIPHPGPVSGATAAPQASGLAAVTAEGPLPGGSYLLTNPVTVIQLTTGKVIWQQDFMADVNRSILVVDNEVLIPEIVLTPASTSVQLAAYSLESGSHLWTLQLLGHQ